MLVFNKELIKADTKLVLIRLSGEETVIYKSFQFMLFLEGRARSKVAYKCLTFCT